ncbi:MAG: tetratricopeptide repeat protein [Candidatus Eremiobacteraeota bacterium]|nr:tetratricopeptide repeat protein [Candidatus Eremiobacteraeota bacterium]MCL5055850.1 tetratricopeptide repeat protein [Bacillota bacterium]
MKWLSFRLSYFPGKDAIERKEWNKAENHLEKATQIFPNHSEAVLNLAQAKWNLEKKEEAFHLIEKLLQNEPESTSAYFLMGQFSLKENQLDKALEYFTKSIQANPKNIEAWYELGKLYIRQNEAVKAVEAFHQVVQQEPFLAHLRSSELQDKLKDRIRRSLS